MFTEYQVIQLILHCLITKTEGHYAQTAACAESFVTEQHHSAILFIIQSTINKSPYHPNTHQNVLLP